ncbi:methyl-accepting chemotaxis protein [Deinococcus ficus]|uniref:methyl-accepting chemotaxis protein n=1 Tax=Deinococcus ficus TaxID=317577 RepID=UPI00041D1DE0|nr:methyl-accepting chemotaxis protein [Deinococcus ficus]
MLPSSPTQVDPAPARRKVRSARPARGERPAPAPDSAGRRLPRWMDRLSVAQKLGLAGVLFALPTLLIVRESALNQNALVRPVTRSLQIMPVVRATSDMQEKLDTFTMQATRHARGEVPAEAVKRAQQAVDASLKALTDELNSRAQPNLLADTNEMRQAILTEAPLDELQNVWAYYRDSALEMNPSAIASAYFDAAAPLKTLVGQAERVSSLSVGGGQNSLYYMKESSLGSGLTELRYAVVRADALASSAYGKTPEALADREALAQLIPLAQVLLDSTKRNLEQAVLTGQSIPQELSANAAALDDKLQSLQIEWRAATQGVQPTGLGTLTADAVRTTGSLTRDGLDALEKEAALFQNQQLTRGATGLAVVVVLGGLAAVLLAGLLRYIVQQIQQLTRGARRLTEGDFGVQIPVTSRDELGLLGSAFNDAAAQLRRNAERVEYERVEAQELQNNIAEYLDVTMDIADGDLTKRGKVTEDVLGNVVDSINVMVDELSDLLRNVQDASQSVTGGSRAMLLSTAQIEQGTLTTAEQAARVSRQAQDVNARIQSMAQTAQESAAMARQTLLASQQGQQAVTGTLEGMDQIRGSSQSVNEAIQALSERSGQIQEIVDSISHIASQTNLLSLHASIEAAGAGEAGSRFAVVAEEVRALADESSAAAGRIQDLIAGVQREIAAASATMAAGAVTVERGYEVARQAGEQLRQIGQLSAQSAQLAEAISQAAAQQAQQMQQMGHGVTQIAEIATDSQASVAEGRSAAEQLQALAQQLAAQLGRFKLPA